MFSMVNPRNYAEGFLFPIPHRFAKRLFSGEKDVFVKPQKYRLLTSGSTLIFYDSGSHAMVGEGRVKEIVYADSSTIWKEFGPRIFLRRKKSLTNMLHNLL